MLWLEYILKVNVWKPEEKRTVKQMPPSVLKMCFRTPDKPCRQNIVQCICHSCRQKGTVHWIGRRRCSIPSLIGQFWSDIPAAMRSKDVLYTLASQYLLIYSKTIRTIFKFELLPIWTVRTQFEFSLCVLKISVLTVWLKVIRNLVTFNFKGTYFWCNLKGNWNS